MKKNKININTFVSEFLNGGVSYGTLIKQLVNRSGRLLLNVPWIGTARKIAAWLRTDTFSSYYIFERTLSHKLHPFLYKYNLNMIANNWIEKHFYNRYELYKNSIPQELTAESRQGNRSVLNTLLLMQNSIMRMVDHDGHFMVVKFYDYILRKTDKAGYKPLRSVEVSLNILKNGLTEDKNGNLEKIRARYNKFIESYGDHLDEVFIERLRWDELLAEYADKLKEPEETPVAGGHNVNGVQVPAGQALQEDTPPGRTDEGEAEQQDRERQKIEKYAARIKQDYIDRADDDPGKLNEIIDKLIDTNKKNSGIERAFEIVHATIEAWLENPDISENKKDIFADILENKFNIAPAPGNDLEHFDIGDRADPGLDQFTILDESNDDLQSNEITGPQGDDFTTGPETLQPDELTGSDGSSLLTPEEEQPGHFDISEKENTGPGTFDIKDDNRGEEEGLLADIEFNEQQQDTNDQAPPGAPLAAGRPETSNSNVTNKEISDPDSSDIDDLAPGEEAVEQQVKQLLTGKQDRLAELQKKIELEIEKSSRDFLQSREEQSTRTNLNKLAAMLNNELYNDHRNDILSVLAENADENLFVKIIHYLESCVFPRMTIREKYRTLDLFIEKYRDDKNLVSQLENYKKNLSNVQQLLSDVYEQLNRIEKKYPGVLTCINQQLAYLEKIVNNETYKPIWPTVVTIYRNLLAQQQKGQQQELLEQLKDYPAWKRIQMLRFFQEYNRENKEYKKDISSYTESPEFKPFMTRLQKEENANEQKIYKVLEMITGETVIPSTWIDTVVSGKAGPHTGQTETKDAPGLSLSGLEQKLRSCDWTEPESLKTTGKKIEELIKLDPKGAIGVLEDYYSSGQSDPVVRDKLLEIYQAVDDPLYKEAYEMHAAVDAAQSVAEKEEVLAGYIEQEHPEINVSVAAEKKIMDSVRDEQSDTTLIGNLLKERVDKKGIIEQVKSGDNFSKKARNTAVKIADSCDRNAFDEAFDTICSSSHVPQMKVAFLEALHSIAVNKQWIVNDPDDETSQNRKNKILRKIEFYKRFINEKDIKREHVRSGNRPGRKDTGRPLQDDGKKTAARRDKADEQETEREDMSTEEKIYIRSLNIIKSFNDNIDAFLPLADRILKVNNGEFKNLVQSRIEGLQKNKNDLVKRTLLMIKASSPDEAVIAAVHKSPAKVQYMWEKEVLKHTKSKTLDEAFKTFEADKELMNDINRIGRIIKNNNKNDFLKMMIDRENKLVASVAEDLSVENLLGLKRKTTSRQDKDKLSLFRDLLRLTGDVGKQTGENAKNSVVPQSGVEEDRSENTDRDTVKKEKKFVIKDEDTYIKKINGSVQTFLNFAKNERTLNLAIKNDKRNREINGLFIDLVNDNSSALKYCTDNIPNIIELLTAIIKNRFHRSFPATGPALKYLLAKGIVKKEELKQL